MVVNRALTPITDVGQRVPEAGRVRLGEKTGKAMRSLTHLRFTSPRQDLIMQIAKLYGGTCKPWHDDRASPPDQFEVIVTADAVPVWIMPGGLDRSYELWSGGGCQRRCDGVTCTMPQTVGDDYELVECPCVCIAGNRAECKMTTRLQVILPEVGFAGVWRLDTKSWNAAQELPAVFDMIEQLTAKGTLVQAELGIDQRSKVVAGKTKKFVVPRLSIKQTPMELATGQSAPLAIRSSQVANLPPTAALTTGSTAFDDDIADGEVVDDELLEIEARLKADADNFGMDPDEYVTAAKAVAKGDRKLLLKCSVRVREGAIVPKMDGGSIRWEKVS